ncbi:MAG TPA: DMT family transporter [Alphaproteobacteria bacterium]|nr:DMT family transporter [Alphaproteobacteria bacterium]
MTTSLAVPADRVARGILFAVLSFGCFSATDATVKWLSADYSVFQIMLFSCLFAFLPVGAFVAGNGGLTAIRPKHPRMAWLRGCLVTGSALCILSALTTLPMSEGYAIVFSGPLIVTVLSVPLLGEAVGRHRWAAVAVGFAGVLIMLRPGFQAVETGHLLALASAILFAASLIVLRRLGRDENGSALLVVLLASTILVVAPVVPAIWRLPAPGDFGLMLLAGLTSGLAHIFLVLAFREAPAAIVSPFQYTQMVWAVIFGLWLFGDRPDPVTFSGATVVIASGLYILWRETRSRR